MYETLKTPGDTTWFTRDRFGLFIHWGLYSLPARHEWVRNNELITNEEYDAKYFPRFDPDLYNPKAWAKAAAGAGMKYFVITAKHHEGFCLWDTKQTDYNATKTPAKRDLLRPMVEAFRAEGIRVGLYYSLIDWHHPDFVIDPHIGPYRLSPDRAKLNEGRDQNRYAEYMYRQVEELLTQYGEIDVLWFDFSYPKEDGSGKGRKDWQSEKLYEMVRKKMPKVIIDDRMDLPYGWDIKTPEQFQAREWVTHEGQKVVWEACQTFSGSWGYHRDEASWKSIDQLIIMLIDTVSKGGNLLLNVGPTGRGEFDQRALDRLSGMGEWMRRHSRSIYGCTQAPPGFKTPQDCRLTYNPTTNRMYVHVLAWPFTHLHLDGFSGKVAYAQLLNDASEVQMKGLEAWQSHWNEQFKDTLTLNLPVRKPDVTVPVIELFLK
ncbi:MAG: alpha-L-fucosidase [Planctomycetota bacterium]|nr:alpha-L-fucosidase [Planctomycetota bacterium]